MKLTSAQAEIDAINREFVAGDYTADEHLAALNGVIQRHGATKEIVKTYGNGIQKICIRDINGDIVAEYHQ